MKDSWDKVSPVTPVRAASPSWQMECENERIVISHRLFASLAKEERAVRASLRSGIAGREMAWGGKEPHLPIVENGCMPYTYYVGDR